MAATPGKPKPPQKPASGSSYSPSVPISVYRELATEVQATKAMLQAVKAQNQQLLQQNQQLRHELDRIVKTAVNVQQAIATLQPVPPVDLNLTSSAPDSALVDSLLTVQKPTASDPSAASTPAASQDPEFTESDRSTEQSAPQMHSDPEPQSPSQEAELPNFGDRLFSEIKEEARPSDERSKPRDLGGLWLTLTIVVIMVTAFGAGFLVMRPFLPSNNNR